MAFTQPVTYNPAKYGRAFFHVFSHECSCAYSLKLQGFDTINSRDMWTIQQPYPVYKDPSTANDPGTFLSYMNGMREKGKFQKRIAVAVAVAP